MRAPSRPRYVASSSTPVSAQYHPSRRIPCSGRASREPNSARKMAAPEAWNRLTKPSARTTTESRSGFTDPELDAAGHDVAVLAEDTVTQSVIAGREIRLTRRYHRPSLPRQ